MYSFISNPVLNPIEVYLMALRIIGRRNTASGTALLQFLLRSIKTILTV